MGVSWLRYFGVLLVLAGIGIAVLGIQYNEAWIKKPETAESPTMEPPTQSITQWLWSRIYPGAPLSEAQAGIVQSGLATLVFGMLIFLLGPLILRRFLDRLDL